MKLLILEIQTGNCFSFALLLFEMVRTQLFLHCSIINFDICFVIGMERIYDFTSSAQEVRLLYVLSVLTENGDLSSVIFYKDCLYIGLYCIDI